MKAVRVFYIIIYSGLQELLYLMLKILIEFWNIKEYEYLKYLNMFMINKYN